MKNIGYLKLAVIAVLLIGGISLNAQSYYDAHRLIGQDLDGTARFVGMGGAMGALGGDISVMGTNPAGIGIYRSGDANLSFGFMNTTTKSDYLGTRLNTDKNSFSFNDVGFVIARKIGDHTPLRFVNFGFNARKVKSFDRNLSADGLYNASQTQQMAATVNSNDLFLTPETLLSSDAFTNPNVPWIGAMAFEGYLMPLIDGTDQYTSYFDPNRGHTVAGQYTSRERGGIYTYDFNIAFNLYDKVYLGATLGVYDVDYRRNSTYSETFLVNGNEDDGNYTLENQYNVEGTGVDFKLGAIVRPFEYSPFRVGLAVSTPVFYRLTERNIGFLTYDVYDANDDRQSGTTNPQTSNGTPMSGRTEYRVRTPWKYNVSMGYTIGSQWALGAEYEYMDYTSTNMRDADGREFITENANISTHLRGVSTFRLGVEYRFVPEFSFRAGFNHVTASINDDAYRVLSTVDIRTDTEYANAQAINNYTFGFGYKGEAFYMDMAYKYQTQKENFYAFDHPDLPATRINNNRHNLLVTLGVRF